MRRYTKGLLGVALLIISVAFLLSMSCSWEIFTQGEIQKEDASIEDVLKILPLPSVEILSRITGTDDNPDSLRFKVFSQIVIDEEIYDFVEMEVGELIDGEGGENDTLLVNHRP